MDDRAILAGTARVPEHVVWREFEAETVLLNLQTGQYHGLNATATRMFELFSAGQSGEQVVATLASEHGWDPAPLRKDLLRLSSALAERGLIVIDADPARESR